MRTALRTICGATLGAALAASTLTVGAPAALAQEAAGAAKGVRVGSQEAFDRFEGHDVFTSLETVDMRRFYIAPRDGDGKVTHVSSDARLPWTLDVDFSLDGPNVDAARVDGASGMVGVHVRVEPDARADAGMRRLAGQLRPVVVFAVPTQDCADISADDGVSLTTSGRDTVVAAIGEAGRPLDFHVFADAKRFSMGPLAMAALSADSPDAYAAGLRTLADQSTRLVSSLDDGADDDGANAALIDTLVTLRDQERALATSEIARRGDEHRRAFDDYMAAYVGSYTTHLSGSVGTKTQLTALMGTAGELKGDTPLAHAVTGLATAVNALSDAHQHTGAADEVDRIIRRIRQQGTQGLAEELRQTAGEQTRLGSQGYSDGQAQLSQAMIPYSMAYTDSYTSHLNELTGGAVAAAAGARDRAIAATNAGAGQDPALSADKQGVDAAMASLAAAREHTGAGSAARQILLRFADRFSGGDASGDGVKPINEMQPALADSPIARRTYLDWYATSIGGRAEMLRAKRIARARASEARQRAARGGGDMFTLVSASGGDAAADVAKYAGSVTSSLGGARAAAGASDGAGAASASAVPESERLANQLGFSGIANHALVTASAKRLVDETVTIASAADAVRAAADACAPDGALGRRILESPATRAGEAGVLDSRVMIVSDPMR